MVRANAAGVRQGYGVPFHEVFQRLSITFLIALLNQNLEIVHGKGIK